MPRNGEINTKFGVYKNLCCGIQMVVNNGSQFPDCPNHRNLITEWKLSSGVDKEIPHVRDLKNKKR